MYVYCGKVWQWVSVCGCVIVCKCVFVFDCVFVHV